MNITQLPLSYKSQQVIELLYTAGAGECLLVGGFVRDHLLGLPSKDIDIEIYGLDYRQIVQALRRSFHVNLVGESFGVVKVDNELDVSIPRRESKSGMGHRGFDIEVDSTMTPTEALRRRDFTINSIAMRVDGTIIDPFGGENDLNNKILRATSDAFDEDPLRVLRAMQFVARFDFDVEAETVKRCERLSDEFDTLAPERIWGEWFKWATLGVKPSKGLLFLRDSGWIKRFPELDALIGCPQNPMWHPEGDVFTHTCLACDSAVAIADEWKLDESQRAVLLFATLCHDFGKPLVTALNEEGNWASHGHAELSVGLAETFLERMKAPGWLIEQVVPLVAEHMAHLGTPVDKVPTSRQIRRLAHRLEPSDIKMWGAVCAADSGGCLLTDIRKRTAHWIAKAEQLHLEHQAPKPLLLGRHLIMLGVRPGPAMGELLAQAFEAQLDGEFDTAEGAVEWAKTGM